MREVKEESVWIRGKKKMERYNEKERKQKKNETKEKTKR